MITNFIFNGIKPNSRIAIFDLSKIVTPCGDNIVLNEIFKENPIKLKYSKQRFNAHIRIRNGIDYMKPIDFETTVEYLNYTFDLEQEYDTPVPSVYKKGIFQKIKEWIIFLSMWTIYP